MKKYILTLIVPFIIGCGGGGSSTSSSNVTSSNITYPITPNGVAIDYSDYAWSITPKADLNSNLDSYNIDANANINMPSTTNSTKIKVAIIDQGFEYTHPDIADKIIDVAYVNKTNLSEGFHGTAIAGILASTYLGVAPDNVELILINVDFDIPGEDQFISAFNYAKKAGAKVINCSWGTTFQDSTGYGFSSTYLAVLQNLKDSGINVVFSSGNNALDLDNGWTDESELSSVIGVGATDKNNEVTSYSNYGSNIDIYAPGGTASLGLLTLDLVGNAGDNGFDSNYSFWFGTSLSAPTISGVIALMLSIDPTLTPNEIRSLLINNADIVASNLTADTYPKVNTNNTLNAIP